MRNLNGATSEGISADVAGGAANQVLVQDGTDSTTFIPNGVVGQVLTATVGLPSFQNSTTTDLAGGSAGKVVYQDNISSTTFTNAAAGALVSTGTLPNFVNGTEGQVLTSHTAGQPSFMTPLFSNPLLVPLTVNSSTTGSNFFSSAPGPALTSTSSGTNEIGFYTNGNIAQVSKVGSTLFNGSFANTDSSEARIYLANTLGGLSMLVKNTGEPTIASSSNLVLEDVSGTKLSVTATGMTNNRYVTNGALINNTSGVITSVTGTVGQVLTAQTGSTPIFQNPSLPFPVLQPIVVNSTTTGSTFTSTNPGPALTAVSSGTNEIGFYTNGNIAQVSKVGSTLFNGSFANTDSSEARIYLANTLGGLSMLVKNTGETSIASGANLVLEDVSGTKLSVTPSGMTNNRYVTDGAIVNSSSGIMTTAGGTFGQSLKIPVSGPPAFITTTPTNVIAFTVAGAILYTPSSNAVQYILIKAVGGGGGGGGGNTNTSSGTTGKVGGGGSGGAVVEFYTSTIAVFTGTVGAGGVGGTGALNAIAGSGTDGGATTIPGLSLSAPGGIGGGGAGTGAGATVADNGLGGNRVIGTGGQINLHSQGGGVGHGPSGSYGGGNSIVPATRANRLLSIPVANNGQDGCVRGGGGGGGGMYGGNGGNGAIGAVYVYEFF